VGIAPGAIFSTQDKFSNYIRLSCGYPWTDELEQGVRTLGRLAGSMCRP
jgi:DNA-binding transcriptional MocR family regulator